jgi:hypothetical protein
LLPLLLQYESGHARTQQTNGACTQYQQSREMLKKSAAGKLFLICGDPAQTLSSAGLVIEWSRSPPCTVVFVATQ